VAVGHEAQTAIQHQRRVAEAGPTPIASEARLDKSEAPDHLADPLGTPRTVFDPEAPPGPGGYRPPQGGSITSSWARAAQCWESQDLFAITRPSWQGADRLLGAGEHCLVAWR